MLPLLLLVGVHVYVTTTTAAFMPLSSQRSLRVRASLILHHDSRRYYFDTLEDLQQWASDVKKSPSDVAGACNTQQRVPTDAPQILLPQHRRRVLHCHDYQGGYKQAADEDYLATFVDSWDHFDIFVYFSHHRVVVPPQVWIQDAHLHSKPILGTFLFEGQTPKDTTEVQNLFLKKQASWQQCADQLVELCCFHGFDGWLVNVETSLGGDSDGTTGLNKNSGAPHDAFVSFLQYLTQQMKERVGVHSQVIYYDSLNHEGNFQHIDALLSKQNKAYFDACDGIFINYRWFDFGTLARSKTEAGIHREFDVYAGVDVWARNCEYTQGLGCKEAVDAATMAGVSVAMFAPGWVQEKGPGNNLLPSSEAARCADRDFWKEIFNISEQGEECSSYGY